MAKKLKPSKTASRLSLLALEPRMVFDGAIAVTDPNLLDRNQGLDLNAIAEAAAKAAAIEAPAAREVAVKREIVFVDDSLADVDGLLSSLNTQAEVVRFDHSGQGLSEILAALKDKGQYDTIHILSHGTQGELRLGSQYFTAADIQSSATDWQTLGQALTAEGDLLVYGCDVAANADGQTLVQEIARLTSADVAASSNTTGSASKSADWMLEYQAGDVQAQALNAAGWQGDLAAGDFVVDGDSFNEASPWAGFTITNTLPTQRISLFVEDVTTSNMANADIKYSLDNGATWNLYTVPFLARQPIVDANGAPVLDANNQPTYKAVPTIQVAVKLTPEQTGMAGSTYEGSEQYVLKAQEVQGNPGYQNETDQFVITFEQPQTYYSNIKTNTGPTGQSMEVFKFAGNLTDGMQWRDASNNLIGTFTSFGQVTGDDWLVIPDGLPNQYTRAGGLRGQDSNTTLVLATPQNYFGFYWAAGDGGNKLDFYDEQGNLMGTLDANGQLLDPSNPTFDSSIFNDLPQRYYGMHNSTGFVGGGGYQSGFINFFAKEGQKFSKVVAYGSNFESDNWTVGTVTTRTATTPAKIADDGSGAILAMDANGNPVVNPDGTFQQDPNAVPVNQAPIKVGNVTVNEGSPYAVFKLKGGGTDQTFTLGNLLNDSNTATANATLGTDAATNTSGTNLEYFDAVSQTWKPYVAGTSLTLTANTDFLVRTKVNYDTPVAEGPETFQLQVNASGFTNPFYGTATIVDDGTGALFGENNKTGTSDTPRDPADPAADPSLPTALVDDRLIGVTGATVNEGSYAMFTINAQEGQPIQVNLTDGTAQVSKDLDLTKLEYFNGTSWVPFTQGQTLTVPSDGDATPGEQVPMFVRAKVATDAAYEGPESFTLTAAYANGAQKSASDEGTILDDGTGANYPANFTPVLDPANNLPQPVAPTQPLKDDRPLDITGSTVNETSPYVFWGVEGVPGQKVALALTGGTATVGVDAGPALQYFDPSNPAAVDGWVNYTPGALVTLPDNGVLQVRTPVNADKLDELSESLTLTATNTAGTPFNGDSTILDVGGAIAGPNEVPPAVSSPTVNEASPYMQFSVTAQPGQPLTLGLSSGTGTVGTDTGAGLEYFNGTNWVPYTGGAVNVPTGGELLVRTPVKSDGAFEGPETVALTATSPSGLSGEGTGTIMDDGTGDLYGAQNNTGTPDAPNDPANNSPADPSLPTALDNDRAGNPPDVSSFTVNEASPYGVFTIRGIAGEPVQLNVADNGTAEPADHGSSLEVYDPVTDRWVAYNPNALPEIPAGGVLLARVPLVNDTTFEGPETFSLQAKYTDPALNTNTASGVATVTDDGTGLLFATQADDPNTPANESNLGVNDQGLPEIDALSPLNDDRPLSVGDQVAGGVSIGNVEVNEASPYAMFKVMAMEGQPLMLDLASGPAQVGVDTGSVLEYFNPNANNGAGAWLTYTPGQAITVPGDGDNVSNESVPLLVRVAIRQDANFEGPESFQLSAFYQGSDADPAVGTATIHDDGTGNLYGPSNTDGQADAPGENGLPANLAKDDDRPLTVTGTQVSEASPYVQWQVAGEPGQPVTLDLGGGSATPGVDTGKTLEYYNGTSWVPYTGGAVPVPASGVLAVRAAVNPDSEPELSETLNLVATNAGGTPFTGASTILDQGGAVIPASEAPLVVDGQTVNEASPYLMFTVTGQEGQAMKLNLGSDTGTVGTDTGANLEYFNGTAWVPYTPGATVTIPGDGDVTPNEPAKLLVRVAVNNDAAFEGPETIKLSATSASGIVTNGEGTITDDGTGTVNVTPAQTDNPNTPYNDVTGLNADGTPAQPASPVLNDDRTGNPPAVGSFTVNEGSPYAVFNVSGVPGAGLNLSLSNGTAQNADYSPNIEVYDPQTASWVPYSAATAKVGADGTLLARVALVNDTTFEGAETFKLNAQYNANGVSGLNTTATGVGTATIVDDGTGEIYLASPDNPATATSYEANYGVQDGTNPELDYLTPKNDDRALGVSSVNVNEASPYAVFTVTATEGQPLLLDLASGAAQLGTDTGSQLEYFDGTNWVPYTPGTPLTVPGDGDNVANEAVPLLVRVAIVNDDRYEGIEDFHLSASYANNPKRVETGAGTIQDNGQGALFLGTNRTGIPDKVGDPGAPTALNDDGAQPAVVPPAAPAIVPLPAAPKAVEAPAIHVQLAAQESRQSVVITPAAGNTAAVATTRSTGGRYEGDSVLHSTDQLIDKFDRPTDPNLFVLPQVKDTRNEAFDAKAPALTLQSGLLVQELTPQDSTAVIVKLSQMTQADQTLVAMGDSASQSGDSAVGVPSYSDAGGSEPLHAKQARHLAAAREAAREATRGQLNFSKQLQLARQAAAGAATHKG